MEITSYTAATPAVRNGEEFLLASRPVERVIGRVRWLWNEHNLAGGVMFEETWVYARICTGIRKTVQWSRSRDML